MKVAIITEGGNNIGFGHITRCGAIYQGFLEKNIDVKMIINGDDDAKKVLDGANYVICDWIADKEQLFAEIEGVDIAIIDSYLAKDGDYLSISKVVTNCVYIDDFNRIEYPSGIVLNASIGSSYLEYEKRDDVEYLLGCEYAILREPFWDIEKKIINKEIKNVMIIFGGLDYSRLANDVADAARGIFNQSEVNIIGQRGEFLSAQQVRDVMLMADICIAAGGQTTYELARCGVPTIGICLADNQLVNLEGWQKVGFMDYFGRFDDHKMVEKLTLALKELAPYPERIKRSQIGQRYVDGNGITRITEKIVKLSEAKT